MMLQELVEKVVLLREAIKSKNKGNITNNDNGLLSEQLG